MLCVSAKEKVINHLRSIFTMQHLVRIQAVDAIHALNHSADVSKFNALAVVTDAVSKYVTLKLDFIYMILWRKF